MHFYVLSRTYFLSHLTTPPPHLPEKALSHQVINEDNTDIWLARQS